MTAYNDDGIRELAYAIVYLAVEDYKKGARNSIYHGILRGEQDPEALLEESQICQSGILRFFHSDWCYALSGLSGDAIMRRMNKHLARYIYKKLERQNYGTM